MVKFVFYTKENPTSNNISINLEYKEREYLLCYAVNNKTGEIIKNDKTPDPDWEYLRKKWGLPAPGETYEEKQS